MKTNLRSQKVLCGQHLRNLFFTLFLWQSSLYLLAQPDKLIFKDDFSKNTIKSKWQFTPFWSIAGGVAYNREDYGSLLTSQSFSAESYVIETTVQGFSNAYYRQFLFTFGQAGAAGPESPTYVLKYSPFGGDYLSLSRATDNIYYPDTLLDGAILYPPLATSRWYKFKIAKYKSGLIQVFLDKGPGYGSVPILETIDTTYPPLGHLGWTITTETAPEGFSLDWIEVRTPLTEKPAIREKPANDNLIALAVNNSGKSYEITKLKKGVRAYTDRDYTITTVPTYLQDASFVRTNMADKYNVGESYLNLFFNKYAIIYVAYDPRASKRPVWLQDWQKTNEVIRTTDPGTNYLEVYSILPNPYQGFFGPFQLGGNLASPAANARAQYLVMAVEKPNGQILEAEEAKVADATIDHNHPGYSGTGFVDFIHKKNDYVEWTIQTQVPGTYLVSYTFANGGPTERSLAITADGTSADTVSFSPLGSWGTWAQYSGTKVYLTRGTHKIRATAIGTSGPNLDHISLGYDSHSRAEVVPGRYSRNAPVTLESASARNKLSATVYPNPFEKNTTIVYSLPEKAAVTLVVYNLQGQKVKTIVNKIEAAGTYTVALNATNLPKGVYLYRLNAGTQTVTGKMIRE
ncbi:T9SS type A sorting domain-containing protein [Adhaeribacter arboris]|nr:T9SS type A sorting domain-containing protein [Adhaeribacter arboris]